MPSNDVYGASVVNKDSTHVVSGEVYRVPANVGADDERVVVRVVLKPKVGFGERDWDMGPRGAEVFAFAHMRDSVEVFFPLPLRLVYRLVRSTGDGVNDIDHASGGIIGSLWDLAWL